MWVRQLELSVMIVAGLAAAGGVLHAADEAPKSYHCEFGTGTSGSYDSGAFTSRAGATIKLVIENIDLGKQSATFKAEGSTGNGKLAVARAIGANHFLEVATEGYWNITTVYDVDPATGSSPAIHSRHSGIVGKPQFAQYTGNCRPVQ